MLWASINKCLAFAVICSLMPPSSAHKEKQLSSFEDCFLQRIKYSDRKHHFHYKASALFQQM